MQSELLNFHNFKLRKALHLLRLIFIIIHWALIIKYLIIPDKFWGIFFFLQTLNNSQQNSTFTRNRELNRKTQTTTEIKFEVSVKYTELNPHPIPTTNLIRHRTFPSPVLVACLHFSSADELRIHHQWGSITFYKPISGVKHKLFLWKLCSFSVKTLISIPVILFFSLLRTADTISSEKLFKPDDPRLPTS